MKKILFFIRATYRIAALFLWFTLPHQFLSSQVDDKPDYKNIFGDQYIAAIQYLDNNKWITSVLIQNNIDPCFAKSIVFPELIRYSYLRDLMEVQALKTLYVQYGQDYANFSVGRFQIKPEFAEHLETDIKVNPLFMNDSLIKYIDTTQTPKARRERIERLDSEAWQVQYLVWFIKVMNYKYPHLSGQVTGNNIRFYATAYNCGYYLSETKINENTTKSCFHTAIFSSKEKYNYASVSYYFWVQCMQ